MSVNTAQFKSHKFLNLETVRKSGVTVATPVWFVEHDGKFYVRTVSDAGKVKRIRNNGQVRIMPCGQRGEPKGEWIKATARLNSAEEDIQINGWFQARFGLAKRIFDFVNALRRTKWQAIEIVPG